MFVERFF